MQTKTVFQSIFFSFAFSAEKCCCFLWLFFLASSCMSCACKRLRRANFLWFSPNQKATTHSCKLWRKKAILELVSDSVHTNVQFMAVPAPRQRFLSETTTNLFLILCTQTHTMAVPVESHPVLSRNNNCLASVAAQQEQEIFSQYLSERFHFDRHHTEIIAFVIRRYTV